MRTFTIASSLLVATVAFAQQQPIGVVRTGDLPGTNGQWQTGDVTVAAPAAEVQRWFTDAAGWEQRFPDDENVKIKGRAPDGRQVVEFRSKALGKTLTVHLREQPGLITYDGAGKGVNTQGKIIIEAHGPNRTRIVMQTTGELHGLTGAIATEGMKRKRAIAKLSSDLNAAARLARASASSGAPRPGM